MKHTVPDAPCTSSDSRGLCDGLRLSPCPACGHQVAAPFYDGGRQPLTTVAFPASEAAAKSLTHLPLSFVRCVDCGHIFNADFDYTQVPYTNNPYFMFNKGTTWAEHLRHVRDTILERVPPRATVVEIGCGDGHLLAALAKQRPAGRYVGFEPNAIMETGDGSFEARAELFEPAVHVPELRPDMIVTRHVLEHLANPLALLQGIAFAGNWLGIDIGLLVEVPCIEPALATGRTADFFYEHHSHFTRASLERLLIRAGAAVERIETGYGDEVVCGMALLRVQPRQASVARQSLQFRDRAVRTASSMTAEFERLTASGESVAIWGGTGKAAAFINKHRLTADRFPLVVDSDANKWGTFVPGTGQEIRPPKLLLDEPVAVVLIATQWRAADIVLEIQRAGISCGQILLEHEGRLVEYFHGDHPYRPKMQPPRETHRRFDAPVAAPIFPPAVPVPASYQTQ
jgi:protein O-GlcNAc transferase